MAAELQSPELRIEEQDSDYVKLVMEPLEAGFGTTVGNALRRVLLSSLPGAAITSVRIEGVDHEFSTIDHMQEDVTELLLNLKEVRLRSFADRPARLFLEASGETEVRAGDVRATADYEVVNPDLHVATLDNPEASLVVDLNVETGRGYTPAAMAEGLPIGVIPIDALFTPVRRVNYNVSHTRVGQDTNYDRLELEVWTDGTLTGEQAISMAADILRDQLQPLQLLGRVEPEPERATTEAARPFDGYETPIEELELSVRAYNCLKRSGLTTVGRDPRALRGGAAGAAQLRREVLRGAARQAGRARLPGPARRRAAPGGARRRGRARRGRRRGGRRGTSGRGRRGRGGLAGRGADPGAARGRRGSRGPRRDRVAAGYGRDG